MNILVVDNNQDDMEQTLKCLKSIYRGAEFIPFDDGMEAVRYGFNHDVDIIYTEVVMRHITGFDVARLLRKIHPEVTVYFLSHTEKYMRLSIQNSISGYYIKPLEMKKLANKNLIDKTIF